MSQDQFVQQDPTEQHASPGSGDQTIEHPGRTGEMDVRPDHGEQTYRGTGRLEGKKAVITGGDSGIGRAVAIAFAREGADLLITHLEAEKDDAEETARWVREAGRSVVTMAADVTEQQNCREVVERAVRELGRIDVLVSNAAYQMSQDGGIEDITAEQFDRVMKTNVYALFWLCKAQCR
jgi:NAD(P)-dependent dehydrogenase (short-subunit alcohol dehydrogenase family)